MNFYSVKIGKTTRRGLLNEITSFVCKTENINPYEVKSHYLNQYQGLDVEVSKIMDVVTSEIKKPELSFENDSQKVRDLKLEVRELKSKLLPKVSRHFISEIDTGTAGSEIIDLANEIIESEDHIRQTKNKVNKLMEAFILKENKDKFRWVRAKAGFTNSYKQYSYEALLRGELVEHNEIDSTI